MKNIIVVADDRVGLLADISYILGKAKINIESISVDVVGGKAVISLTVKDVKKAREILENSGYKITETNALLVKLVDRPGELSKVTSMLAQEQINIENVHMLSRDGKTTILAITVDKPKKAEQLLRDYLIRQEDVE
jgi:hypothetical protein